MAYYGDKGASKDVNGKTRKVQYIQKYDGYDPAHTIALVDELIDSEKVFAKITLGSPNTMKTYDKLNQTLYTAHLHQTGHPAWGDPVNHPWTTGLGLAYTTEAVVLWGTLPFRSQDALDGGLTRSNLLLAARSLDMTNPFQLWASRSTWTATRTPI